MSELLQVKPTTLGVSGILLSNGKSLVETLQGYEELTVSYSDCLLLQHVIDSVALLTPEHQEEFMDLDVDDKTVDKNTSAVPPLTLSPEYLREAKTRATIGRIMCIVLAVMTLMYTATICWVSIERKEFPDWFLVLVVVGPVLGIGWQYMGLINKERRDLLSVVLGDNQAGGGFVGSFFDFLASRRRPG